MKSSTRNIFFFIGLVFVILMILTFKVSFRELWQQICHAGYWLVAIIGMWVPLYIMNTFTWRTILLGSGECNIPFWKLLKVTISGFALNYATPVGLMGGEPYKIMEIKPYVGVQRASSSTVLFAMMHIFSHFWYWVTALILYLIFLPVNFLMGILLSIVAVFCLAGIYLFVRGYRNGMVVKLVRFISKIPGCRKWGKKFAEKNADDLRKIDMQIAALHSQNKRYFFTSFFLEYIGRILQSFEIFFMLMLFADKEASVMLFVHSLIILAFTSLFANLLFFIPLQIGGREGGFMMVVSNLGMTVQVSMSISIICRVREIFWTSLGLFLMKFGNSLPVNQSAEKQQQSSSNEDPKPDRSNDSGPNNNSQIPKS